MEDGEQAYALLTSDKLVRAQMAVMDNGESSVGNSVRVVRNGGL